MPLCALRRAVVGHPIIEREQRIVAWEVRSSSIAARRSACSCCLNLTETGAPNGDSSNTKTLSTAPAFPQAAQCPPSDSRRRPHGTAPHTPRRSPSSQRDLRSTTVALRLPAVLRPASYSPIGLLLEQTFAVFRCASSKRRSRAVCRRRPPPHRNSTIAALALLKRRRLHRQRLGPVAAHSHSLRTARLTLSGLRKLIKASPLQQTTRSVGAQAAAASRRIGTNHARDLEALGDLLDRRIRGQPTHIAIRSALCDEFVGRLLAHALRLVTAGG